MAAKKKKRRRPVLKGLTAEELQKKQKEADEWMGEIEEAMAKLEPSMDDIRKALQEADSALNEVGEFHMETDGDEYVIRLSQNVKGRIRFDPNTRKILIELPDASLWRPGRDGRWNKNAMNMRIDDIVKLHESRREVHWLKGEIERILELNALSGDARENEMARQLTAASRKLFDYENRIECLERLYMLAAAEADRISEERGDQMKRAKIAKKRAEDAKNNAQRREAQAKKETEKAQANLETVQKDAEKTIGKLAGTVQKQGEELKTTRARNSRLARENNKIKKGRQEPYKTPSAGKKGGKREAPRLMPVTVRRVADQHRCHKCHHVLGGAGRSYTRTVEDMEMGRWEVIEYEVTRKWCPRCRDMISTPVPGVMPKQRFGNRALGMLSFLKMLGVSFRKIELIFMVFYNVHISKKTIQEAVRKTSDALTPHYEAIHAHILKGKGVNGDETGWRVAGLLYWVWCVVGDDAVWFNIQKGRGSEEAKKMLEEFVGMVTSDSWPAWNHVGTEHQKCHLHYKRDINTTMEENKGAEFQAFAKKLKQILWDSHTKEKGHDPDDDLQTRERKRRNLMRRLAYLMNNDYTDGDCKRYIKRLRREFYHLFSHVISGIDWHNNKAERAVRCFVLLRHVMFSNRTELDADTYAKLLSIIGTAVMRGVNPLEYMVEAMSQPHGSPVELPRPPTDGDNTWPSSDPPSGSGGAAPTTN